MHQPPLDPLPQKGVPDYMRDAVLGAAEMVPFAGGPLAVLLNVVLPSSIGRRRDAWLEEVRRLLDFLLSRPQGYDVTALADNEQFMSLLFSATQTAMRTHRAEKRARLRACLTNVVLRPPPTDVLLAEFTRLVDELEEEHILVLSYAVAPRTWLAARGIEPPPSTPFETASTVLPGAGLPVGGVDLAVVLRALERRGLIDEAVLLNRVVPGGPYHPFATGLGVQFHNFVGLPEHA